MMNGPLSRKETNHTRCFSCTVHLLLLVLLVLLLLRGVATVEGFLFLLLLRVRSGQDKTKQGQAG